MNSTPDKMQWHTTCDNFGRNRFMAAKSKLLKFLQEAHGLAEITNRRPAPRSPMLYLMQLRAHTLEITMPKRRLSVDFDINADAQIRQVVKIKFPKPAEASCADTLTV